MPATPLATPVRPGRHRASFASLACLDCGCDGGRAASPTRHGSYKPPLAAALSEAAVGLTSGRSKHHLYAETREKHKSESSIGSSAGRLCPESPKELIG